MVFVKKHSVPLLLRVACIIALFCTATPCRAQIEFSSGIDMSYPLLLNKYNSKWTYDQLSFGVKAGIGYKPDNTQFFPVLNLSFGRTKLPLDQLGSDVASINFNYLNVMLNENYIMRFTNSMLYVYGGIGFSYLIQEGIAISGKNTDNSQIHLDSTANTNHAFPAINLGIEYVYGSSVDQNLYLSLGLNVQYIYLLPNSNTYYGTFTPSQYNYNNFHADLTGHVISPGFFIAVHYRLIHHNRDSHYL